MSLPGGGGEVAAATPGGATCHRMHHQKEIPRILICGARLVMSVSCSKGEPQKSYMVFSQQEFLDHWKKYVLPRYFHTVCCFCGWAAEVLDGSKQAIFVLVLQRIQTAGHPKIYFPFVKFVHTAQGKCTNVEPLPTAVHEYGTFGGFRPGLDL